MAVRTMEWVNRDTGARTVWFSERVSTSGTSDILMLPDGKIEGIGAKLITASGVTGTFVQTQEGTVAAKEIETLTITAGAISDNVITITLNDIVFAVEVLAGDTINQVAGKIRAQASLFLPDWVVTGATANVIFTANANGVRAGAYTLTGTGTAAIEYSFSPKEYLENGRGIFIAWDNSAVLNPAITAWQLRATAGGASAEFTVKTLP
jgi:hypothetical protein